MVEQYQQAYQTAIAAVQAVYCDQNKPAVLAEKIPTAQKATQLHQKL